MFFPKGSIPAYQAANQWKVFFFMEESDGTNHLKGDVNGDGKVDVADIATIITEMAARARKEKTSAEY